MFMVVLNDGNYLQQAITIVLIFVRRPCTLVPSFVKKKKKRQQNQTKKKKNRQAARPKVTIPGREYRILLNFTLRICANSVH